MQRDKTLAAAEVRLSLMNIERFFEMHAWTHEPRPAMLRMYNTTNPAIPFLLFPKQIELVHKIVDAIKKGESKLIEKSRDVGVSWLVVTVFLWFWLQKQGGNDFLLGSRKFEYVDKKGAQDTLFQKFRYNIYYLENDFLPEGWDSNNNDNIGLITNPETGSFIRAEANNANFATSGRYKAILLDEFSKWEETDSQAWTSTIDSSPCRLPVSTPWGMGRKFAQLRFSDTIDVLTFHWKDHPLKAAGLHHGQHPVFKGKKDVPLSEWYISECEKRRDNARENIGQELDIDYLTSGFPYFDNTIIQQKYIETKKAEYDRYFFMIVEDKIVLQKSSTGDITIIETPPKKDLYENYRYCISADTAEGGEGGDYSAMYVYDRVQGKDVAWYRGHCDTDIFAMLLHHFSVLYKDAYILPENNSSGHATIQKLKSLTSKIGYQQDFSEWTDIGSVKLGWNTNPHTRPIMLSELREAIREDNSGILDPEFYSEALTFIVSKKRKPEADVGCHDDRIIAQAIKLMLHSWLPAPKRSKLLPLSDYGVYDHGKYSPDLVSIVDHRGARFV